VASAGVRVVEVDRADRQDRHRQGKSDPLDAVSAARAALSGRARGRPKGRDGPNASAARPPGPTCAAPPPSPPGRARPTAGSVSTPAGTAKPTTPYSGSCCAACAPMPAPATTRYRMVLTQPQHGPCPSLSAERIVLPDPLRLSPEP
jgi:hypothetical protein